MGYLPAVEPDMNPCDVDRGCEGVDIIALEALLAPDRDRREGGLKTLLAVDAHRYCPLVASILAHLVDEPCIDLRKRIVTALAQVLYLDTHMDRSSERVLLWLHHRLGMMRRREIFALVQIAASSPEWIEPIRCILDTCSFSGGTLLQILSDRKADLEIRAICARLLGELGYLDALEYFDRLEGRLRRNWQNHGAGTTLNLREREAKALLPALHHARTILKEAAY